MQISAKLVYLLEVYIVKPHFPNYWPPGNSWVNYRNEEIGIPFNNDELMLKTT